MALCQYQVLACPCAAFCVKSPHNQIIIHEFLAWSPWYSWWEQRAREARRARRLGAVERGGRWERHRCIVYMYFLVFHFLRFCPSARETSPFTPYSPPWNVSFISLSSHRLPRNCSATCSIPGPRDDLVEDDCLFLGKYFAKQASKAKLL